MNVDRVLKLRRLLIDAGECSDSIAHTDALLDALKRGVELAGVALRQTVVEPFNPHGATLVLVLGESHLVLSTWPEHRFVSIDAALCTPDTDLQLLVKPVIELLDPQTLSSSEVETDPRKLQTRAGIPADRHLILERST